MTCSPARADMVAALGETTGQQGNENEFSTLNYLCDGTG